MANGKGKFIVIDGTDGSGKTTQIELLAANLRYAGFEVELADFPQYNTKSAGLVENYLEGRYGTPDQVGPYRASIFYAADRYDASFQIKDWLKEGKIVIANRYVTANMGHQGGKISNPLERKHFFNWLYQLEYEIFNIPKPDLNIILHVPAQISQNLARLRIRVDWENKTNDIHQEDLGHLEKAEKVYLEIAKSFPDITLVECARDGRLLDREQISGLVWEEIIKLFKQPAATAKTSHLTPAADKRKLKVELISPWAKLPTRAYAHDAGLDIYSAEYYSIVPGQRAIVKTGLKLAIPEGFAGLIWDKGGVAKNGIHAIAGVIDSGFRGEVTINLINLSQDIYHIAPGQKIAQLLIQKVETPEIVEGQINDATERDNGHFGSSGLF